MRLARAVGAILALVTAALGVLGFVIARKVTAPVGPRAFDLIVRSVDVSGERPVVVLARSSTTAAPGEFTLIMESGDWVRLGTNVSDVGPGLVGREVTDQTLPTALVAGARASWSGIMFRTPADAGLRSSDVEVPTSAGDAPAWLIPPEIDGSAEAWAIHIHGLGSPRAGTLRGVQGAAQAGLTSLVVSYRNDGEGPTVGNGRSTLGALESDDVEAAVRYALEHGARRIILFGWSMGGAVALQLADRAGVRENVAGIVLESPVLHWVETIKANCARAGMPRWVGVLALPWLDSPSLAPLVGLAAPIGTPRFDQLTHASGCCVPILLLHGTADRSVPFAAARRFAQLNPIVELVPIGADHTMTWNADPVRWGRRIAEWLDGI